MVDYREILRLKSLRYTNSDIASSVHSYRNTIQEVLSIAEALHIQWQLDDDVTNKKASGSKNGTSKAYPASTTKIITAMAALKYCPVTTTYTIGNELDLMWQGSSPGTANLKKGQTWTLAELLYATLLPSGNDAAYSVGALTIQYLYPDNNWTIRQRLDKFAELMNEVAMEAGAQYSHFMVPDGNIEKPTYDLLTETLDEMFNQYKDAHADLEDVSEELLILKSHNGELNKELFDNGEDE